MAVEVKCVSDDVLDAEWAIAYTDEGTAYFIVREDALGERVLREAWSTWEELRTYAGVPTPVAVAV